MGSRPCKISPKTEGMRAMSTVMEHHTVRNTDIKRITKQLSCKEVTATYRSSCSAQNVFSIRWHEKRRSRGKRLKIWSTHFYCCSHVSRPRRETWEIIISHCFYQSFEVMWTQRNHKLVWTHKDELAQNPLVSHHQYSSTVSAVPVELRHGDSDAKYTSVWEQFHQVTEDTDVNTWQQVKLIFLFTTPYTWSFSGLPLVEYSHPPY